ncbi:Neuronal acetylcholine receptor subunit alpha-6 [Fasciola gigantica]|uniref:Neuronal acetylcholine receptor subunit alpha-6 n=1 Tax=Fasciola gigantica TaxID=46835 RepID=A0A504YY85_FASGI|nr:Neuronal acetylcholine receptor subunit alpha-6 [Fasciola gigantica]
MRQLKLLPMQHGPAVDNYFLPNSNVSEWEIQSIKFELEHYRSQFGVNYQYINISIQLRRQPLYFIILVLVPFMMLSILACLIFTLDDTGDRLSVALSLILSMTMYVVIVSSNAPRSMRTVPLLGIFLLDQLGLLCIATVIAVLNNKLHQYKDPNISPMDLFLLNKPPTTYDMTMENYNSHETTSPEESDEFLQVPSEEASLNGETADPYTRNRGQFRPTQDALGFLTAAAAATRRNHTYSSRSICDQRNPPQPQHPTRSQHPPPHIYRQDILPCLSASQTGGTKYRQ